MDKKKKIFGTLAPIFSLTTHHLPSTDSGTIEAGLYFLDWLKTTNQSAWQILPANETQLEKGSATKHVPSPYKGYGIGLAPKYLSSAHAKIKPSLSEKNLFIAKHREWIEDYALFCSIRDVYGTDDWRTWDKALRNRQKSVLQEWAKKHKTQINYYIVQQWQLHASYTKLHNKAKALGIRLISDLPFYLSVQSPLVWAHQKAFQMQPDGTLEYVSGIPNTAGTFFGRQIWGHPLYNWQEHTEVMQLWRIRLEYQAVLFEDVRFDHAKAFFSYGAMDPQNEANDHYANGPGDTAFTEVLGYGMSHGLKVFAEDSGDQVGALRDCLRKLHIPGIKIYRFAMKEKDGAVNEHYAVPSAYPQNAVAYTTTHDTSTLFGYVQRLTKKQKKLLAEAAGVSFTADDKVFAKHIRNAVLASPAQLVIVPIQDWLLTTDRINMPGTEKEVDDPNWRFTIDRLIEELPALLD